MWLFACCFVVMMCCVQRLSVLFCCMRRLCVLLGRIVLSVSVCSVLFCS